MAAPGHISYRSEQDIEEIMDILRYNDYQTEDADFLTNALVYGTAAELMYVDGEGKTRFKQINPSQCFGIYDDSLSGDLIYFVRIYRVNEWDYSDNYNVDIYSDKSIKTYTMVGMNGELVFAGEVPHYFSQCPANIFYLPDEKNIFDCVMSLQDSANELLSGEIDDFSAFCDAYLCLEGVDADIDDINAMKESRVMLVPAGSKAYYLTKPANDSQVENIMKRIHDSIYRIAQCPDFSSESFVGGVSSGIAIQYRLTGMENRAALVEGAMKKALQRRIEIICGIATLKMGEEVFRDIEIDFVRNVPADETAQINMINSLKGIVSDETLLGQLDFIANPAEEVEKVNKQKKESMAMYSLSSTGTLFEEDEEAEV
jgi:SPP1 family phage portal protein